MTARNPPSRRPEAPERGPLPAIGQDAIAGQPFPPSHWRERTVRPAPPILHRQVRLSDLALNQLRHQSVEPSLAEHVWIWVGAIAALVFVVALLVLS